MHRHFYHTYCTEGVAYIKERCEVAKEGGERVDCEVRHKAVDEVKHEVLGGWREVLLPKLQHGLGEERLSQLGV